MNPTTIAAVFLPLVLVNPTFEMPVEHNKTCPVNYICYAIDRSFSISPEFYRKEQQFVIDLSRELSNRTENVNKPRRCIHTRSTCL